MYELTRLSFHNWYVFEARDLDIGGMVAVIGPTGAGKSAILDGIQVVITGDNHNFIDLNPSAGEKSDRTVVSYCLGQISDFERGEPRRDRSETVLALTFRHTETGSPVSIGVLLQADRSERLESVKSRFIARGYAFSFADFIERDTDGDEFVVTHDEIIERLKAICGKEFTHHATASQFVAEFLTVMRPRASPEARLFLRSFNNAVLAREIRDPTDFVRRFVLEAEPLNVERIRSSIETWRSLEKRAQELEDEIKAIRAVRGRFATWARQTIQVQTEEFVALLAERVRVEREIEHEKSRKRDAEEKQASLRRLIANHKAAIDDGNNEILRKRSMIADTGGARLRAVEVEAQGVDSDKRRAEQRFEASLLKLTEVSQFSALRAFVPLRLHAAIEAASQLGRTAAQYAMSSLASNFDSLGSLVRQALTIIEARQALAQQRDTRVTEIAEIRRELSELEISVRSAGDGRVSMLSPTVRQFMDALTGLGISSTALPDLVEVIDDTWAPALEMLLGPNREAVVVREGFVEQAFEFLWRNRSQWHTCRIVNTRRTKSALERSRGLPANSIVQIVRTHDPDIRAFLEIQAGRFVRVDGERELQNHDHAIMRNGKTTAALALRVYRDLSPVLGKTAQAAAISSARTRLTGLNAELKTKENERQLLESAIAQLDSLVAAGDIETSLRNDVDEVRRADARLKALAKDRDNAEDPRSRVLRREIDVIANQTKAYREELSQYESDERTESLAIDLAEGRIQDRLEVIAQAKVAENAIEFDQNSERNRSLIAFAEAADYAVDVAKDKLAIEAFQKRGEEIRYLAERRDRAKEEAASLSRLAKDNGLRAAREFNEYVGHSLDGRSPLAADADYVDHCFWCATREQRLEEHELRPHRQKVIEARHEFEAALKEDLLAKMSDRFEKVKTQLDVLNRRLSNYSFVGQRYSFKRSVAADFKPLHDLVRRVISTQDESFAALADRQATADEEMKRAIAQVEDIVTRDEDTRRMEDYRNYFEFELVIQNQAGQQQEFSKLVGWLSGGQRQAPYYVAIAASMVSVYFPRGPRDSGTDGMGLVAFDEAFNKLDIGNTQNLIKLYRDLGLQLVIAAPEVHRATFLESVDCIVSVTRIENSDEVIVDAERIGPRARAEMAAANPEHRGVTWYRSALEETPQKAAE